MSWTMRHFVNVAQISGFPTRHDERLLDLPGFWAGFDDSEAEVDSTKTSDIEVDPGVSNYESL